jgi:hypothetical protein
MKLAASAAHVTGKNLVSAESFTWLGEHFSVSLADVKGLADRLFLAGVNHIFFHGTPYSPAGRAVARLAVLRRGELRPATAGLWRDLPAFNAYVARVPVDPASRASRHNDVLLYYPQHEVWQDAKGMLEQYGMHKQEDWLWKQPFYAAGKLLNEHGYSYDAISDRLLEGAKAQGDKIEIGGGSYAAIVIPNCRLMPPATLKKLADLASGGARVIMVGALPTDVPGLGALEARREEFKHEVERLRPMVVVGSELAKLLEQAKVPREQMAEHGLGVVRRLRDDAGGRDYFVANRSKLAIDDWVTLGTPAASAVLMDPMFADRTGIAATRRGADGATQVYLQLSAGESRVLRTFAKAEVSGRRWEYSEAAGEGFALNGNWHVHFVDGGPELPHDIETKDLASWTTLGDDNAKRFSGTAQYVLEFDAPSGGAEECAAGSRQGLRQRARDAERACDRNAVLRRPTRSTSADS